MNQLKILALTPDYFPQLYGGIGTYVGQLYHCFDSEYLTICFIPYNRVAPFPQVSNLAFFDVHSQIKEFQNDPYVYWGKFNETAYENLLPYLEKTGNYPDILHVHGSYFALLAEALKKKFACKVVYIKHGVEHNYYDPDHLKDSIMLLLSDQIICPSQWIADEVLQAHPLLFAHTRVIHSGIELQSVSDSVCKENKILFCGRICKRKGVDILVKAVARISSTLRALKYTVDIIGMGDQKEFIRSLIQSNNLHDIVTLKGYMENYQVLNEMARAQILVVPSLNEPFGLVAIEGFSQKMCVVASRSAGLEEIIADQETGILFEPGNDADLARILKQLALTPETCQAFGERAWQMLPYFSWERVHDQYQEAAKELVGQFN